MVIKGGARAEANKLAAHLLRVDMNERVDVRELLGVCSPDLTAALLEMEAIASAACSRRPFYHASINTAPNERMNDAQKARAIDRLEQELGLTGQPRIVVEHVKEGREHLHVAWSRIDGETLKAIPDSHNFRKHEIVARELEREFGHERVQGAHHERDGVERPGRCPSHAETRQSERSGISPEDAKAQLRELWQSADSGQAFVAALDNAGWTLARGDKRGFVALDPAGEVHAVNKAVTGLSAAQVRDRLADLDADRLPGVDEARTQLRDRQAQREAQQTHESDGAGRDTVHEADAIGRQAAERAAGNEEPDLTPPSEQAPEDVPEIDLAEAARRDLEAERASIDALLRGIDDDLRRVPVPETAQEAAKEPQRETQQDQGHEPKLASDPVTAREAWADRLRAFDQPDPAAQRAAWAERLRGFDAPRPEPQPEQDHTAERAAMAARLRGFAAQDASRKAEPVRQQERTLEPEPPAHAQEQQRGGLFQKLRDFVRNWWEPAAQPEPSPDRTAERQHDHDGDRPEPHVTVPPARPPRQPSPPRPVERFGRSISEEMLDEARNQLIKETPQQRADREKLERDHSRGDGSRERHHHHSFLQDILGYIRKHHHRRDLQ